MGLVETMIDRRDDAFVINQAEHARIVDRIVAAYGSLFVRAYCRIRFAIINNQILQTLEQCIRGQSRVLDLGCGFGLLGCYFAMRNPAMQYVGYDLDAHRIAAARNAATRLGLTNLRFECADAASLKDDDFYDAMMAVDLLHHIDPAARRNLLSHCRLHLLPQGKIVIKDVSLKPRVGIAITWLADVVMTRSFNMWYMSETDFRQALDSPDWMFEIYPISTVLPFPHVVYLCYRASDHWSPAQRRSKTNGS